MINFFKQLFDFSELTSKQSIVVILVYVLLVLFIFITLWGMYISAKRNRTVDVVSTKVRDKFSSSYYKRQEDEEQKWLREGEQEKKPFMYKFDRLIEYSGVRKIFPFISSDVMIILYVVIVLINFFLFYFTGWGALLGGVIGIAICVVLRTLLRLSADRNYDLIENDLLKFINAVESESHSSDDLVTILDHVSETMCKPLKNAIEVCCREARGSGRILIAMRHFELSIENEELRTIIRNLSMAQNTDAEYSTIIEECRLGLREHISAREERKAQMANGRMTLIQLAAIGVLSLWLMGQLVDADNVFSYLWSNFLGKIVIIYNVFALFLCVMDAIMMKGRK